MADENGIDIPRFCYHKKLSIASNCRMCLVEVKNIPKSLPACATFVNDGMEIFTNSKQTKDCQQSVMEFLLINHPLDCPICDQGGECDLQDTAMAYGSPKSRYQEEKRVVLNKKSRPLSVNRPKSMHSMFPLCPLLERSWRNARTGVNRTR